MALWKSRVSLPGIVGSNCTAAAALIVLSLHPASERDAPSSNAWMLPILLRTTRDTKGSAEWHLREIARKKSVIYYEIAGNPASPYRRASLLCHSKRVE